jgi:hypothetical protein
MAIHAAMLAVLLLAAPAAGETATVKREGARLMAAPRFYGRSCPGEVRPGAKVRLLERRKGWARVAEPGAGRCWLHESAWSDRVAGELTGDPSRASQRDVELAGRGFTEAEEARYRGEHRDLDGAFRAVDAQLERGAEPAPEVIEAFRTEGELAGGGAP